MNLLALESSTTRLSVALLQVADEATAPALTVRATLAPRAASEQVLALVSELLAEAGLTAADLSLLAVSRGPGMFTGVRMGLATSEGIAFAVGCPLLGIESLAALALTAAAGGLDTMESTALPPIEPGSYVTCADARKGEIYAASFAVSGHTPADALLTPRDALCLLAPGEWLPEAPLPAPAFAAGTGFEAFPDLAVELEARGRGSAPFRSVQAALVPSAAAVAWLAHAAWCRRDDEPLPPASPVYLRSALA